MRLNVYSLSIKIVKARFGTGPHLLFTFYAFMCNMIVCGSLLRESRPCILLFLFLISPYANSWRCGNCERVDGDERDRMLLFIPTWDRYLCYRWVCGSVSSYSIRLCVLAFALTLAPQRSSSNIHYRLDPHRNPVYHHLHIRIQGLVSKNQSVSLFYSFLLLLVFATQANVSPTSFLLSVEPLRKQEVFLGSTISSFKPVSTHLSKATKTAVTSL